MGRPRTATSPFGVSRRESHDATGFYARFTPPEVGSDADVWIGDRAIDDIFWRDAREMPEVPDRSVALVVTSPPYFAGKEYEAALGQGHVPGSYLDFLGLLEDVFAECVRKLEPGGRIAVNVANLGRRPYRSLSGDVTHILQDRLRLLLRGEIVWHKARGSAGNCAWGSFQRPANPVLRDLTERVVVASKGRFDRALSARQRAARRLPSEATMSRDHFMALTTDVWEIPAESATRVGHPAPFPVELPERLIHLYTYRGDLVLDPMMGGGATAVAAVRTGRHFAGYDTDAGYVEAARKRAARAVAVDGVILPAETDGTEGRAAREVAADLLTGAGLTGVRPAGDITFRAQDEGGGVWLFEVVGAFSSARPGLRRLEHVWKAAGKAAAASHPVVVLTTDMPGPGTPADAALRAVSGPGKPLAGAVLISPDGHGEHRQSSLHDLRALLGATRRGSPGILG